MATAKDEWDRDPDIGEQGIGYFFRGVGTLWALAAPEKPYLMKAFEALLLAEGFGILAPLFFKALVDELPQLYVTGMSTLALSLIAAMAGAKLLGIGVRRFVQEPLFIKGIIRLENRLPQEVHKKFMALSQGYHEKENTGRKVAKVNKGVERIIGLMADGFWMLIPACVFIVVNLILISWMEWKLGFIMTVSIALYVWINIRTYVQFYAVWERYEDLKEQSVGQFCESIMCVRTVQAFVQEAREVKRHGEVRAEMCDLDIDASIGLQKHFFLMESVLALGFCAALVLGMFSVAWGHSTVGTVAYLFAVGSMMIQSLWGVVQVYTRMLRYLVAAQRIKKVLDEPSDVQSWLPAHTLVCEKETLVLALNQVSHCYPGKNAPVLSCIDMQIKPGSMIALVGRSGAGKSTVVHLAARISDPTNGSITLNGVDVRSLDRDWYRRLFAVVPQDVELFECSLLQNITYAYPDAPKGWIDKAVKAACLDALAEDTKRFPDGLQTAVGERGVRLSGGERQRVGIARAYIALLSGARFLILDEATSSLDSESERVVQTFIQALRCDHAVTIIAIAHRLSTIRHADEIVVIDDGSVTETGTHDALLKKNGLYARLTELQQLGEIRD